MQKNYLTRRRVLLGLAITACMLIFFISGLFHLSKFETVDEHFWKYERVPRYWLEGILEHNPLKTYINDKPGVSTAIISGLGLPFIQNPVEHRIRDAKITSNDNYTVYDSNQTEKINFALRFPLLLFNTFFLIYFFWIIKKLGESDLLAVTSTFFIASSPILIGISQIINPDTLLWSFGSAALITFWVLLRKKERKYLILTIFLTGLALLSKYTAGILFALYLLSFFSHIIFNEQKLSDDKNAKETTLNFIFNYFAIFIGSAILYAIGMPAAIVKLKYLYRGTIGSPSFHPIMWPVFFILALLIIDAVFLRSLLIKKTAATAQRFKKYALHGSALLMLVIFSFLFINSWFGQKFINLDNVREVAYFEKKLQFPMFAQDMAPIKLFKEIATEIYPLPFSIAPIAIFFILFLWIRILQGRNHRLQSEILILTLLPLILAVGGLISGVLLNPRYMIIVYPLALFLASLGAIEFIELFATYAKISRRNIIIIVSFFILTLNIYAIISIKPFYFNYMSFLLPKDQLITDSWGYGSYEAAQYINSLPNAEDVVIWADRSAICQFIKGKCIRDYKIDILKTKPDYLVFTRRGSIRHQFLWKRPELAKKSSFDYYDEKQTPSIWSLAINGRGSNFIRIVKSEE